MSQSWRVDAFMRQEHTRVAARATSRVGYAFHQMGVCQGLERRRRDDFRRADDPDGLPVVWASDLREPIIKALERVAEAASRRCTVSTRREERAALAQTAPDDGKVVALDVLTTPPRTTTTSERRARRRPAGTSRATLADRPGAQPRLNVFYIPKDGACPKMRSLRPQNAIKRIYFNSASPPVPGPSRPAATPMPQARYHD